MALDLVTGYKGQNHVTAEQWADFNRGIYGDAAILPIGSKMQVEIQTANQITVKDGTGVFDGRQVYIGYGESENIAIESGTQQMLRHDIVVIKYTKDETSGVENVAFEVITGTPVASDPTDPSYQDMDIRTGVFTSQKPFCRVRLNGVAIEGVDMLVEVKEFADHAFEPLAENLTTSEPGRALDATMGKQLKESMDELEDDVSELTQNMNGLEDDISELTSDMSGKQNKISNQSFVFTPNEAGITTSSIRCFRYGNVCIVTGTFTPNQAGTPLTLGGFNVHPTQAITFPITGYEKVASYGTLSASGVFQCNIPGAMANETCAINFAFLTT